jgi:two-component system, LytTR family, response regulator
MTKINIVIVDDEPKSIETLTILLNNYHNDVNIIDTANSMTEGISMIEKRKHEIDILFLDIQMPDGDGFSLLQQLPKIDFKIIFTTAYDQYAIKAIKLSALDYLLKPIDNAELKEALQKYKELKKDDQYLSSLSYFKDALRQKTVFEKLAVTTLNEIKFIELSKIRFLQSDNNYTTIHLDNNQQLVSSKNIGYYEELLESTNFFRIHNSYLVNLKKIERFIKGKAGAVEIEGGITLDVSVRRKDSLFERLNLSK